jgi:hypothetical protein
MASIHKTATEGFKLYFYLRFNENRSENKPRKGHSLESLLESVCLQYPFKKYHVIEIDSVKNSIYLSMKEQC